MLFEDLTHKPNYEMFYKIEAINKETIEVTRSTQLKPCHSYVQAFLQQLDYILFHPWGKGPQIGIYDTAGTVRIMQCANDTGNYPWSGCQTTMGAGSNNGTFGIVVGTGTNLPKSTDVNMQTKINNGVGAGQLNHGVTSSPGSGYYGSTIDLWWTRMFSNASRGAITLKEIGMICSGYSTAGALAYFLILRDAVNFTINNGEYVLVSFVWRGNC
jgi:hypothetical protein